MSAFIAKIEPWHVLALVGLGASIVFLFRRGGKMKVGNLLELSSRADEHTADHTEIKATLARIEKKIDEGK